MSSTRLDSALQKIDSAHAEDPNKITVNDTPIPYELHYAQKMTSYLFLLSPFAPETLQLAIRAQHFRRWEVPRSSYPMTKPGYHAWRTYLKKRQAELASSICVESGYGAEEAERVAALIRKEDLKKDEETQVLEDVACLVFLDDQFEAFRMEHDEEKIVGILRKTWGKMSERGREVARGLEMGEEEGRVLAKALEGA